MKGGVKLAKKQCPSTQELHSTPDLNEIELTNPLKRLVAEEGLEPPTRGL